jgi:hypothetical protein
MASNALRTWNQLSDLEQAANLFSDAHKDAYGFRPRYNTSSWTIEDFDREIRDCSREIFREEERSRQQGLQCQREFEEAVQANLDLGAADRATAIRWFFEANGYEAYEGNEPFAEYESQNVESVLYGLGYPIPMWQFILREIWPHYTGAGFIRNDLTVAQITEVTFG